MLKTFGMHWYMIGYTRFDSFVYVYYKNGRLYHLWKMSGLGIRTIAYELHELHKISLSKDGLRYLLGMIREHVPETFRAACMARYEALKKEYEALKKEYEEIGSIIERG